MHQSLPPFGIVYCTLCLHQKGQKIINPDNADGRERNGLQNVEMMVVCYNEKSIGSNSIIDKFIVVGVNFDQPQG